MRTTLNLDDDLTRLVKRRAAESGQTMTQVFEQALREFLVHRREPHEPYQFRWESVAGRPLPGVDLTDRDALYDLMERP